MQSYPPPIIYLSITYHIIIIVVSATAFKYSLIYQGVPIEVTPYKIVEGGSVMVYVHTHSSRLQNVTN